ncbi:MAG TPA: TonB-dependent receptor, partial [Terriglobia bacterium]|nr:TonB-dependent receptor [Terriglobia bacterium]
GQLRYYSVFGPLANTPTLPDCSDAVLAGGGSWDPLRATPDTTGFIRKYLDAMPRANRFDGGDGLNTAVHQWLRGSRSNGSLAIGAGTDTDTDRKQINFKVDHSFNTNHKASVNYSYEWTDADYALSTWPSGHAGYTARRPTVLIASFTSTLGPTLLNEARFGYRRNELVIYPAYERPDDPVARQAGLDILIQGNQGFPIAFVPATVGGMNPSTYICQSPGIAGTGCAQQGNKGPLTTYADTLSWVRGKHAFKWGGEYRTGYSNGWASPTAPIPQGQGGAGLNATQAFQNTTNFPAMATTNQTLAAQLLYFLSGSANNVQQYYFLQNSKDLTRWENYLTVDRKIIDTRQNEFAFFFKDDWKVRPSLTLNLGLRYEYYGVPYENNGLATAPIGGGIALLGVSGRTFDRWLRPDNGVDMSLVTTPEFVGPNTVNPDKTIYRNDWNNFGPAVGFAWELPWGGKGKTNIRGGYQMTFSGGGRAQPIDNFIFSNPGFQNLALTQGPADGSLFDMTLVPGMVHVPPSAQPMQPIPVLKLNQNSAAFDYNISTPYVQNFTLSVTRRITPKIELDVRYIATRGLKLNGNYNLNVPNVFYNAVLFDDIELTRQGEDVELFYQMFMGLNLNPNTTGFSAVNGTTQRGSRHLRQNTTFRTNLANGDFAAVATSLDYFNGVGQGPTGVVPVTIANERGTVLRRANRGFNVPGGTTITGGPVIQAGLFPENWISANPQFNQANYYSDSGSSIYHSLQIQGTLRPMFGVSFQGTYLWSRALGIAATGYTNPAEREKDYILAGNHRTHEFRSNGTFELPVGPNKLFFPNTSGWVARLIERWETSFILNLATGAPTSITAGNSLYANGIADVTVPRSLRTGDVEWGSPGANNQLVGNYFGNGTYTKVADPQCAQVAAQLTSFCSLLAVADSSGQIVYQNAKPGTRGTVGRHTIENPGTWELDANIRKSFQLTETKTFQIRLDATNIMNHPSPNNPTLGINSTTAFGLIAEKNNNRREFQAQLRLVF